MRVLIVEDELELQSAIAQGLRMDGYAVDVCGDGIEAEKMVYIENYDLVLLDLNLPGLDGYSLLSKIREEKPELKVLILSARGSVEDKVKGLDNGANDYLTKPFDFAELEARIRNLLRRKFLQQNSQIYCGSLCLDLVKRMVFIQDKELLLTKKEFALLEYLMMNQNRLISQTELMEHVWDSEADSFSGAIRVHMASLRKKLRAGLGFDPVTTKIGEGYILKEQKEEPNV